MDNLRAVIKNLFCHISPKEILKGNITYDNVKQETFVKLGNGYINKYTNDEMKNMFFYLQDEFEWQCHKIYEDLPERQRRPQLNVFEALTAFNYTVLLEEEGEPLCQYLHLLRWRDMIVVLEEDLFITSFLAMRDVISGKKRYNFFWKPVIGHNNIALNKLVAKGVAENHFHLKGSAPLFHLSWLSLMNNVNNDKFVNVLHEYDRNKLQKNINYDVNFGQDSLVVMWREAALIRLFLFVIMKEGYLDFKNAYIEAQIFLKNCNQLEKENIRRELERNGIDLETKVRLDDFSHLISVDSMQGLKLAYSESIVADLLENAQMMEEYLGEIQENIERIKGLYGKSEYDYTLCESWLIYNSDYGKNEIISGERWFMYSFFSYIYRKDEKWEPYINWFYLYLVLKANIRMELVQANQMIGFDNFYIYQERKEELIEDTIYEKAYLKMAIRDTILNQHIVSLEARIAPKDSGEKLKQAIQKYDRWICDGLEKNKSEKLRNIYFYVMHFIKEKEETNREEGGCRHSKKRIQVKKQAQALAQIREQGQPESKRIYGIDASSNEIGCRPEVFAQAFRYLKNHTAIQNFNNGLVTDGLIHNNKLMLTYHVGEDFLDIIDGLRAIDEVIYFLNMKCGDRLGHALALGVDIDEWYESKSNRILVSRQDYLDNIVWLYAKIREYGIMGCEDAQIYIEKRFNELFDEIYINNIMTEECKQINQKAANYFDERNMKHGYYHHNMYFGINEYYDAWKLRGDDPELYRDGFLKIKKEVTEEWEYYGLNKEYPRNYKIRYNPEIAILYYMYHYNLDVMDVGKQMIEVKVKPCIIQAVKKVRYIMQRNIAQMGIGIETNPSSNYLIGTFRRYDKHPIYSWYNTGLTYDTHLLEQCPQIQVSINTDDQGVFSTYIENEYAYLALALEKSKDKDGKNLYNRTHILQWLENVRRMGIEQSFK